MKKFQDLVLEHLAKLTQEITELKIGQGELKTGLEELKIRQERFESKLDLVHNHTAKISEDFTIFQTSLGDDIKYLKYKQAQNEEDLFKLKSYLKMTK